MALPDNCILIAVLRAIQYNRVAITIKVYHIVPQLFQTAILQKEVLSHYFFGKVQCLEMHMAHTTSDV